MVGRVVTLQSIFRGEHFRLPIGLAEHQLRYALTGFGLQGACAHHLFGKFNLAE